MRKERGRRQEQRRAGRFGFTADKKAFVDASLVGQLADGGFSRPKAIRSVAREKDAHALVWTDHTMMFLFRQRVFSCNTTV